MSSDLDTIPATGGVDPVALDAAAGDLEEAIVALEGVLDKVDNLRRWLLRAAAEARTGKEIGR